MRVWHSAWSWLKEMVSEDSVAGNTLTGMLTRLTFRNPFQVGRGGMTAILSEWVLKVHKGSCQPAQLVVRAAHQAREPRTGAAGPPALGIGRGRAGFASLVRRAHDEL